MAHNKLYRNFIILQEDERGYAHANDKALSGYAKIEAKGDKCKVSFYAQNLNKKDNYSMVLICCKRDLKQLIDIGPLAINEVGKGDTSKEYYVNNIAGLGISYEKISGAAICRIKDNENEFVMHGFMNGEDSADNWRKFKFIRSDSKKYISKLDTEPIKKDIGNLDVVNKTIESKSGEKAIKSSELQNALVERKKDESILLPKENIELGKIDSNNSKIEEKQNRVPENYENISETKETLGEDRKKCKEPKKDEKYEKCDKCDKLDDYNHYEKNENVEEGINKLAKSMECYEGIVDIKMNHHIHEDVIVYGFIKDKNNKNCKWKKFKLEKKCKPEEQGYSIQSYKRIEENFELDKLNKVDNSDRMDIIDFDKYENEINQPKIKKSTAGIEQTTTENMGETGPKKIETSEETIGKTGPESMETSKGNMVETGPCMEGMAKIDLNVYGKLDLTGGEPISFVKKQPATANQCDINGSVGKYFEKIAKDFIPYFGDLTDINYCKWYKIDVNSIDDLSDESNYNQYTLAYYPMLNYYPYISKVGHFLLGYKCNKTGDMKYIVYAIPGSKDKKDQPYGGRTGFVTWTSDSKSGKGYWLMFYDFKNSSIVIPTR